MACSLPAPTQQVKVPWTNTPEPAAPVPGRCQARLERLRQAEQGREPAAEGACCGCGDTGAQPPQHLLLAQCEAALQEVHAMWVAYIDREARRRPAPAPDAAQAHLRHRN